MVNTNGRTVSIRGLDKAEVLVALYNNSHEDGEYMTTVPKQELTIEAARKILKSVTLFDHLGGRVLKVDLTDDNEFDPYLYDFNMGLAKTAQEVVNELYIKKNTAMVEYKPNM